MIYFLYFLLSLLLYDKVSTRRGHVSNHIRKLRTYERLRLHHTIKQVSRDLAHNR